MAERPIADGELVAAWERAQGAPAWQRPLRFLEAVGGVPAGTTADELSVGVVAASLLRRVGAWWPIPVDALMRCAACGEHLGVTLPLDELLAASATTAHAEPFELDVDGHHLVVRPARPADVAAAARDADDPVGALLTRCVLACEPPAEDLRELADVVGAALEAHDPLATTAFGIECPNCGNAEAALADLATWGWELADARVRRLFIDVHLLASAYGWTEDEVLALGPHRRAAYLELVTA